MGLFGERVSLLSLSLLIDGMLIGGGWFGELVCLAVDRWENRGPVTASLLLVLASNPWW